MGGTLLGLLEASLAPNSPYFIESQQKLQHAKDVNLPEFICALTDQIVNPHASPGARHLAGILIKNCFERDGKTDEEQKAKFWSQVTHETLTYIKNKMITIMKNPNELQSIVVTACSVISRIAEVELSRKTWPEFFSIMLEMASSTNHCECRSSLTCLSYLIEDLASIYENHGTMLLDTTQIENLLPAVVKGMYAEDILARKSAVKCLGFMLCFIHSNISNETQRAVIIDAICSNCAASAEPELQTAAFDVLVQFANEHYDYVGSILPTIAPLLWQAIDSGIESVAIPALEFWNTICEIEIDMDAKGEKSCNYMKQAVSLLLPKVLYTMTLHEHEYHTIDSWTLPMAAGVCLSLCAQVVKDEIVSPILQFVMSNFSSPEWNKREAAVLAYGYLLEGPNKKTLELLVKDSFSRLCDVLSDPSIAVQDTAAWTIGRIANFHAPAVLPLLGSPTQEHSNFSKILRALFQPARVAVNICYFLSEMTEVGYQLDHTYQGDPNYHVDSSFSIVCNALIERSTRPDAFERNLNTFIYSCICSYVSNVSEKCLADLQKMMVHFLQNLINIVGLAFTDPDFDPYSGASSAKVDIKRTLAGVKIVNPTIDATDAADLICGVVQVLTTRLGLEVLPFIPRIWIALDYYIAFLTCSVDAGGLCAGNRGQDPMWDNCPEDALLALSALINVSGDLLIPFAERLVQIAKGCLMFGTPSLVKISVELVSDLSRLLNNLLTPHTPEMLNTLFELLRDPASDKSLKPLIVLTFGDIAMAINGNFVTHLAPAMQLLLQAASTRHEMGPVDNEEWIYYVTQLRESALQAFTGIAYGLKEGNCLEHLQPFVQTILEFVQQVADTKDGFFSASTLLLAITLVGDLVTAFGPNLSKHLAESPLLSNLENRVARMESDPESPQCREKLLWLRKVTFN